MFEDLGRPLSHLVETSLYESRNSQDKIQAWGWHLSLLSSGQLGVVRANEDLFIISFIALHCNPNYFSHHILIVSDSVASVEILMTFFRAKK